MADSSEHELTNKAYEVTVKDVGRQVHIRLYDLEMGFCVADGPYLYRAVRADAEGSIVSKWPTDVAVEVNDALPDLVLSAELPGIKEDDIEIKLEDNTLTIKGERKFEKETKEENYHRIERSYGTFSRSFTLPAYIEQEKIEAECENGILKIRMPKKQEAKSRKVKVLKPKQVKTEKKTK